MKGTVKFFNANKGYGFITPEGAGEGDKDIFVHATALERTGIDELREGDKVEFETEPSKKQPEKGPVAVNVKILEAAP